MMSMPGAAARTSNVKCSSQLRAHARARVAATPRQRAAVAGRWRRRLNVLLVLA